MEFFASLQRVEFLIALVALFIGLWHLYEIRAQAKALRSQAKALRSQAEGLRSQAVLSENHRQILDSIQHTLTTRHIGKFPEYVKALADLIDKAQKEIVILCDFPAYGSFSNPHDFLKYRQALERKSEAGVPIRIICLNSPCRIALSREQFSLEENEWDKWKSIRKERLAAFLRSHETGVTVGDLSIENFTELLEHEDMNMLSGHFEGAAVLEISGHLPIYFWLIDGSDAVFSIPSFSEKATEHGFHTTDAHLIAGLQDLEARYRKIAPQIAHNPTDRADGKAAAHRHSPLCDL